MCLCIFFFKGNLASALWWNKKGFQSHWKGQIPCWDQHPSMWWPWYQQVPTAAVCIQPGPQRPVHIWKGLQCSWPHSLRDERPWDKAASPTDRRSCLEWQWHMLHWWVWQNEWKYKVCTAWSHGATDSVHCKGEWWCPLWLQTLRWCLLTFQLNFCVETYISCFYSLSVKPISFSLCWSYCECCVAFWF